MINWKVILILVISLIPNKASPQDYDYRKFTAENDGLAQSFVYSIIQDLHGYLWIGTANGLSRYDGFEFVTYTTSDSIADNFITSSINDGESVWFGHSNGQLTLYNKNQFHAINLLLSNSGPITHFAKSPDGNIWGSTYADGLIKLNKEPGYSRHYIFKEKVLIISFEFLDESSLLIATNTGLLYCRLNESGEIEIIRSVSEIPESKVSAVIKMRNETGFYIATENDGIFQLTYGDNMLKVSKILADRDFEFKGLQDCYEDRQSNLWLCTFGKGLIKINYPVSGESPEIIHFDSNNEFASDNVKTIYEDLEGNIWSGNYGNGLTRITQKTFSVYKLENPEYGNNIFAIWFTRQFKWIGTENGLVKMDPLTEKVIRFYGQETGLPKDMVTTIYSADEKNLWIGTDKNGIFRIDIEKDKIYKHDIAEGTLENSINIITGKGDQVWAGTKKGLYYMNTVTGDNRWYTINQGGLPHNVINCLFSDKTGKLWVGTRSNSIVYIQDEKVFKTSIILESEILAITEDSDSRIWLGSNGRGILMIESDSISNITEKEGLLSNYCYSLFSDDNNIIWIGHNGGLSRIKTGNLLVNLVRQISGPGDIYKFNRNAIIKDPQGKIWFGSDLGLVSFDPSMQKSKPQPPVLGITSIRINDEPIDFTDKIILSPGNYKVRFDFIGISLKDPELVTYQFKLEGYDQWSEITKNTYATYNRVSEGNYTFILKSSSGDGTVTEIPCTVTIIIKKPVWKKWWFYPTNLIILIIMAFIYIKRREYKFLAEKKILEEKVRERTYEIQSQKNEIELQRDMIDEKNANITSSITYASHIQLAVLPPIELIDRFFPENFMISMPKDIVSGDFYWLAEKDHKIIFSIADCTGHGVPGAFMSLLGITLLNEIVNINGITRSDEIINVLRERVVQSLQQGRQDITTPDGMDIALCVMDRSQNKIQYTGGMSDLVFIKKGKLNVLQADRLSVCASFSKSSAFTKQEIEYNKGDVLYLFSDGYVDQFGGEFDKKFLRKNFYLTLLQIHKLPMSEQRDILKKKLSDWMEDRVQTDDITVMGIRL